MVEGCCKEPCQKEPCSIRDFILSIKIEHGNKVTVLWECLRCGATGAATLDHVLWANTRLTIGTDAGKVSQLQAQDTIKLLDEFLQKHSDSRDNEATVWTRGGSKSGEVEDLVVTELFVTHNSGCC